MSRRYITKSERAFIEKRANYQCEYCRILSAYAMQTFVNEHIISIKAGGDSTLKNLAFSCGGCNAFKYDKIEALDEETDKTVALFNPRSDDWSEHFKWSENKLTIIGLTAIGRATIELLRMNREGLINLRKLLLQAGEHPPK